MKKNQLLFIIGIITGSIFAQSDAQKQSIELPEFVITGKETYELPAAEKIPAPFIPTISEEFLKPVYSPEFLEATALSSPLKKELSQNDSSMVYLSKLGVQIGNIKIPAVSYSTILPLDDFTLSASLNAVNNRAFVTNGDNYFVNPGFEVKHKVVEKENFFDNNELIFRGDYNFSAFKLYGIQNPLQRKLHTTDFSLNLANTKNSFWQYNFLVKHQYFRLSSENLREGKFSLLGSAGFSGRTLEFTPQVQLTHYVSSDSALLNVRKTYFLVKAPLQLVVSDVLSMNVGLNFTATDSITVLNPSLGIGFKLKPGLMFFASYQPAYEIFDYQNILKINRYAKMKNYSVLVYPTDNKISLSMMIEVKREFAIITSLDYYKSSRLPYFEFDSNDGSFRVDKTQATAFSAAVEVRMQPGEIGYFYGKLKYNSIKDSTHKIIPYSPNMEAIFVYGYTLVQGVTGKAGLKIRGGQYADLANLEWMKASSSLFVEFGYAFAREFLFTFKIDNLLNKKNYIWKQYQEMPLDIVAGVNFQW